MIANQKAAEAKAIKVKELISILEEHTQKQPQFYRGELNRCVARDNQITEHFSTHSPSIDVIHHHAISQEKSFIFYIFYCLSSDNC